MQPPRPPQDPSHHGSAPQGHGPAGAAPAGAMPAGTAPAGAAPRRKGTRGRVVAAIVAIVVILLVVAAAVFLVQRNSPENTAKREIGTTLTSLSEVSSFADFGDKICAQYKPSQELTDQLSQISEQSGVDFDQQFTERIKSSYPASLEVTSVDVDGDDATAHITSTASDDDGAQKTEETVRMRKEDGTWLVCDPAVDTNAQGTPTG